MMANVYSALRESSVIHKVYMLVEYVHLLRTMGLFTSYLVFAAASDSQAEDQGKLSGKLLVDDDVLGVTALLTGALQDGCLTLCIPWALELVSFLGWDHRASLSVDCCGCPTDAPIRCISSSGSSFERSRPDDFSTTGLVFGTPQPQQPQAQHGSPLYQSYR